jgi:hypothetical protein
MRLRLKCALGIGHPIFDHLGNGGDNVGERFDFGVGLFAFLTRLQPFGRGLAEIFERAGDIERQRLGILHDEGFELCRIEAGKGVAGRLLPDLAVGHCALLPLPHSLY